MMFLRKPLSKCWATFLQFPLQLLVMNCREGPSWSKKESCAEMVMEKKPNLFEHI